MKAITVSQLSSYIGHIFKKDQFLGDIVVEGEVSGKSTSAGIIYFNLKDVDASIRCVVFRTHASRLENSIIDGQTVQVQGTVSTYAKGSNYQIIIRDVVSTGKGKLYQEYLELKEKLAKEGLFDPIIKKEIVSYPKTLGIITSNTGAALRDVLRIIQRRYPILDIILYHSSVQGHYAEAELLRALNYFDQMSDVDLLLITRGGGSFEDLFVFNSEALVRRIHSMKLPVVAAIGHEIDTSLVELAADLRAATPSEAAELITPDLSSMFYSLDMYMGKISSLVKQVIDREISATDYLSRLLKQNNPVNSIKFLNEKLESQKRLLDSIAKNNMQKFESSLKALKINLDKYNNQEILARGYSISTLNGNLIDSVDMLITGDMVKTYLKDGSFESKVVDKESKIGT